VGFCKCIDEPLRPIKVGNLDHGHTLKTDSCSNYQLLKNDPALWSSLKSLYLMRFQRSC
jgi:hypothetical protein